MAYIIVNAEVTRTFYNGLGAGLKETFKLRDGGEGAKYYSAFFDSPHGLNVGDSGKFSGLFSAKVRDYEKQDGSTGQSVDVTLNNAKAEDISSGGGDADSPF